MLLYFIRPLLVFSLTCLHWEVLDYILYRAYSAFYPVHAGIGLDEIEEKRNRLLAYRLWFCCKQWVEILSQVCIMLKDFTYSMAGLVSAMLSCALCKKFLLDPYGHRPISFLTL